MNSHDLAYIAGFFDGEGCVLIGSRGRRNYRWLQLHVTLTNTDRAVLEMIRGAFATGRLIEKDPGAGLRDRLRRLAMPSRPCFELIWTGRQAEAVLQDIYPYLRIKKGQAEVALRYRATYHEHHSRRRVPEDVVVARQAAKDELHRLKRP